MNEAEKKLREAWASYNATDKATTLTDWRIASGYRPGDALFRALADLLESAPVEGGASHWEAAFRREGEFHANTLAKLAAAEKERDELREDHRFACKELERAANARDEAKREAEAMRDEREHMRAVMASQREALESARRSYSTQIADLTRALEAEKKAHSEALGKLAEAWKRGEPSAPAMHEVCAAAKEWHDVDRELDVVGYARATGRLIRAVRAMETSRG